MKAGAVHSRVCKFMSASFVTTGFGRSGNTDYPIGVSGQRPRGSGRAVMDWTSLGKAGLIESRISPLSHPQ